MHDCVFQALERSAAWLAFHFHFMCMDNETLQKKLTFTFEEEAFHHLPETNHLKISSRENVKITNNYITL